MSEIWSKTKYIIIFFIVIFVGYRLIQELKNIDIKTSILLFKELATFDFLIIISLGILGVMVLSLYDIVLKRTLRIDISYKKLIPFSFIINSLNNILGFGGLFGSGLRYYFYKDKTTDNRLLKSISLMMISFITGLGFLSLFVVLKVFGVGKLEHNFEYTQILMYVMVLLFSGFIIITTLKPFVKEARFLGITLTTVSTIDWLFASGILFVILRVLNIEVPYGVFLGVFTVAAVVGLLSMIPGGFGAFDLVVLAGLSATGVKNEILVLALLLYRVSYYFIPFILALVLMIGEFRTFIENFMKYRDDKRSSTTTMLRDLMVHVPTLITGILTLITGVVYMLGHVLILYNLLFFKSEYGFYFILVMNIAACFIMVVNSFGVASGSKRAHLMSIVANFILIITTMLSYGTILSGIWLLTLMFILFFGYRVPHTLASSWTPAKIISSIVVFLLMMYYNYLVSDIVFDSQKNLHLLITELFLAVIAVIIIISFIVYVIINKQVQKEYLKINRKIKDATIKKIINIYEGGFLSHLAFSGDKSFYINHEETAFIMYKKVRNTIIVLGDPIGDAKAFVSLLESFYDKVLYMGYDIVFYQVQYRNLSLYHEFGNIFFKLGEEALIPLGTFTLQGKRHRAFRSIINRFEKEGYEFEVLHPPYFDEDLQALKQVSERWLDGRKEMHFSVGQFNNYYLRQAPIGIIKNKEKEIIAFTSFMPVNNKIMSVDLIRWNPNETLPMMDALYLNMLLYAKAEGYEYFNMGMATLSNVGQNKYGYLREKAAGVIFEKVSGAYNFGGLRHYKEKYKPIWEERYLVYRKYNSIIISLLRVIKAIRSS